jgi:hypothetical protein
MCIGRDGGPVTPTRSPTNDSSLPCSWLNVFASLDCCHQGERSSVFGADVTPDASVALAHQLIAALLNIANETDSTSIQGTLSEANNLIGSGMVAEGISPSSPTGQQMENDESILDDYNNGGITNACQGGSGPPQ